MKRLLIILAATIFLCSCAAYTSTPATPTSPSGQPSEQTNTSEVTAPPPVIVDEPEESVNDYEDAPKKDSDYQFPEKLPLSEFAPIQPGMYKVGTDIPSGIYLAMNDGSILSSVTVKDGSSSDANVLVIDPFSEHTIIEVSDGEYVDIRGAVFVDIRYTKELVEMIYNEQGLYCEGMYWVGYHIPAGEFKLTANEESLISSYTIYGDAKRNILDIEIMSGSNAYAELKDGQFIKLVGASMVPV